MQTTDLRTCCRKTTRDRNASDPMNSVRTLLAMGLSGFLAHCIAPSQHDPRKWPEYKVAFADPIPHKDPTLDPAPWRPDQLVELQHQLVVEQALGPTFSLVSESEAMLLIRPFDAKVDGMPDGQIGRYQEGANFVECDPALAGGYEALRACVGHEIGHWLHLRHVCREPNEVGGCSPVGYGVALMNPSLAYGDATTNETFSQSVPTSLDLDEFRATRGTPVSTP